MNDRIATIRAIASGAKAPAAPITPKINANPKDDPAPPASPDPTENIDMSTENAQAIADARKEAAGEATKNATVRFSTVLASDEFKGREALGQHLLATTDLGADAIIATLAAAPAPGASALSDDAQRAAAEEAGRKEMRDAIAGGHNSDIDAGGGASKPNDATAASAVWDKGIALAGGNVSA